MDIEQMRRDAETPVRADAASLEGVSRDLAAAFVDDPLFNWFSRTDARRDKARLNFFRFFMKTLVLPTGETLRPASGGGAAVWMGADSLAPNTLSEELRALPILLALTGWSRFGRLARLREVMDKAHPTDRPHAYLWFLGVTPEAQGHGIGSRLLKAKLDRLDVENMPAFLETATERNVALYRRHGFDVLTEYRPAPDAPRMWAMWREAAGGGG